LNLLLHLGVENEVENTNTYFQVVNLLLGAYKSSPVLLVRIGHHVGALTASGSVKLLSKTECRCERHSVPELVPAFVIVENVGEVRNGRVEVVGHNSVELLVHFTAERVAVKSGLRDPAPIILV